MNLGVSHRFCVFIHIWSNSWRIWHQTSGRVGYDAEHGNIRFFTSQRGVIMYPEGEKSERVHVVLPAPNSNNRTTNAQRGLRGVTAGSPTEKIEMKTRGKYQHRRSSYTKTNPLKRLHARMRVASEYIKRNERRGRHIAPRSPEM